MAKKPKPRYVLKLYVTGNRPLSLRAIRNLRALLDEHLPDRYELAVIDLYQNPELAKAQRILAAPTLIKELPFPLRRLIGDLSNKKKVMVVLDLK